MRSCSAKAFAVPASISETGGGSGTLMAAARASPSTDGLFRLDRVRNQTLSADGAKAGFGVLEGGPVRARRAVSVHVAAWRATAGGEPRSVVMEKYPIVKS